MMRRRINVRVGEWCPKLVAIAMLAWAGCDGSKPAPTTPPRPFAGMKLVVGVVGDPAILPSVKAQQGEWMAQTGAELSIRDQPVDPSRAREVDVLVFPGDRMGDLVDAGALAVLPDSELIPAQPRSEGGAPAPEPPPDPLQYKDIVTAYRDLVARYGPDRMGLPIGGSALVVAYRRKAFDDPATRQAAQAAGLTVEPPRTWEQFDALARFFQGRDWDGDGKPGAGLAIAWGADPEGVGDDVLLARVASMALHPDQFSFLFHTETTEPRVTSPPFVEALKATVALKGFGPPDAGKFDADAARKAFRSGKVALLIDRAERAGTWSTEGSAVGVAPLPGSDRLFDFLANAWTEARPTNRPSYLPHGGGWLVGVVATSPRREAGLDFARHLAGPESTNRLRAERGFPMLAVRSTQLAQGLTNPRSAPGVEPRSWADAVSRTLNAARVAPGLRIPDATGYLADLARTRVAASEGEAPEKALEGLAKAWSDRTRGLGLARQTWHHRRSLNGLVTLPETAVLLIAHGSRHAPANEDLFQLVARIAGLGEYRIVEPAFLELAEPEIAAGGARCVERGAARVLMVPYFLSAGVHLIRDLTAARDDLKRRHPSVDFRLGPPLGPDPLLDRLVADRVRQLDSGERAPRFAPSGEMAGLYAPIVDH